MSTLWIVLVLNCAGLFSAPDVACPTCAGAGEAVLPCEPCNASGKADCQQCGPVDLMASLKGPHASSMTEAERKVLEEKAAKVEETMEKLREMGLSGPEEPGYIRCPASCRKGRPIPQPSALCRVCAGKGKLTCPTCKKKGTVKCQHCAGRRKALVVCPDCTGSGKLPDPSARPASAAAACAWCDDRQKRGCHACDVQGKRVELCHDCLGARSSVCKTCNGTQRQPCRKCYSTGNLKAFFGKKDGNRCDRCKTKGFLQCGDCKSGKVPCGACPKGGVFQQLCQRCGGTKELACTGCDAGAYRSWDVSAALLASIDDHEGEVRLLEIAIQRAERRHAALLTTFVGSDRERRARKKELTKIQRELNERLAAARGE